MLCGIISCSDREEVPSKGNNQPPSQVKFKIENISHDSAFISWEKASDPEGDEVKYSIELDGKIIVENSTDINCHLKNLEELKNYNGKIIVTDSHKNSTVTTFSFQTKKYYLTFVKDYILPGVEHTVCFEQKILKLSDGSYLVGGHVYLHEGFSVFLMKVDYVGNEIWKKNYDIQGESSPETFKMKESKGEIILTACYTVAKLDLNGNLKWKNRISTYDNGYGDSTINSFAIDSEDNIYAVGTLADRTNEVSEKGIITKLTKDGVKIWEKQYLSRITETGENSEYLRFVDADIQDNQLVIFGDIDISGRDISSNMVRPVFYLLKADTEGRPISEKTFYNNEINLSHQLIKRKNGNYLLSSGKKIIEIDKSGQELWSKTIYNSYFAPYNIFFSVLETSAGNILFVGKENSTAIYFLTDSNGNTIWKKHYNASLGYTSVMDVVSENDQGFRLTLVCGNNSGEKIMIIKTDPDGNF